MRVMFLLYSNNEGQCSLRMPCSCLRPMDSLMVVAWQMTKMQETRLSMDVPWLPGGGPSTSCGTALDKPETAIVTIFIYCFPPGQWTWPIIHTCPTYNILWTIYTSYDCLLTDLQYPHHYKLLTKYTNINTRMIQSNARRKVQIFTIISWFLVSWFASSTWERASLSQHDDLSSIPFLPWS